MEPAGAFERRLIQRSVSQFTFSSSDVWRGAGNFAAPFCSWPAGLSCLFCCGFGELFKELLDVHPGRCFVESHREADGEYIQVDDKPEVG